MDTQRTFLLIIFSISVFFLIDAWQRDHQPPVKNAAQTAPRTAQTTPTPSTPAQTAAPAIAASPRKLSDGNKVVVKTDYVQAEINTVGGDLRRLELLKHLDTENKNKNFTLLQHTPNDIYVAQSGLTGAELPNHNTVFTAEANSYELAPGQNKLQVRLTAPTSGGLKIAKVYTFHRNSYVIDVAFEISNTTSNTVQPHAYFRLLRDNKAPAGGSYFVPTYTGAAFYTDKEKFHKIAFEDLDKRKASFPTFSNDGWVAMLQHYFVSAWLPANGSQREFVFDRLEDGLYTAGVIVPVGPIAPGATKTVSVPLYAGPQDQENMRKLAPGLDLTIDYGWLTIIATPLFLILSFIHKWVQNWGVAIILLTVLIKLIFYPLSATSYRSMAKMRTVTPKLQRIKEQYGSDRQRMQQAMMELYRTEKINPFGSCLPILVQIPVFIALYWVLLESVELRHAPFMLWINDLSRPDPYFVLPILMGITMIIQSRLNPTPPDPIQAKMMKIMPIAFSIFFFFFPAGLVLYWLVNNILSIAQQWHITRTIERAGAAHAKR